MNLHDEDRDPVDVLAEEFAERLRQGERPSVGDYAAAHPQLAEQLRELLPAVAQMEQLKRFRRAVPAVDTNSYPDRLGDFRIIRELGRGGMGVVFEAVQESLGRRVALKVLSAHAQLDSDRRQRFIREAKAAARLHHTNIVPIFGVGEQDGLPYYVMQLIPGRGLHRLVAGWKQACHAETRSPAYAPSNSTIDIVPHEPAAQTGPRIETGPDSSPATDGGPLYGDWRFAAEIGIQIADALQYAHDQGVLHRDVKPANLLLDDRGLVWVADFGLAKLVDHNGLTATGHILGTLQYLAPECLHGEADPRSDVYGLGATLYEIITLSPPYDGDSPARLIKQIADSEPPAPRVLNPAIPRDLETIILKALAREPERRYASPALLAHDLRAFLEDRPILARRETWVGRGWRWCRRNPAVAALSFTTVAALLLATVFGWVGYVRTDAALAAEAERRWESDQARASAEHASARLEQNLRLSLEAFESVFEAAGGADRRMIIGPRPGTTPPERPGPPGGFAGETAERASVLEAVLDFYDRFAEQNDTNSRLRFEAAKAHRRVGEVHLLFGRQEKAVASFRRAAALLEGLRAESPDDADIRFETMLTYSNAPGAALGAHSTEEQLVKALELGKGFNEPPRRWAVGSLSARLGWAREQLGKFEAAKEDYRRAIGLLQADSDTDERRRGFVTVERAIARQRLAVVLTLEDNWAEARDLLATAAGELKGVISSAGRFNRMAYSPLIETYQKLADAHTELGDAIAAEEVKKESDQLKATMGPRERRLPVAPPPREVIQKHTPIT